MFSDDEKNIELPEILDRLSSTIFAGSGWITTAFRNIVAPSLKKLRRFQRKNRWIWGIIKFIILATVLLGTA